MLQTPTPDSFEAAREDYRPLEVSDVRPLAPLLWRRRMGRMPQVIAAGVAEGGGDAGAAPSQTAREIVVFAAPAAELFVEAVDPFQLVAPHSHIPADELRTVGMTD